MAEKTPLAPPCVFWTVYTLALCNKMPSHGRCSTGLRQLRFVRSGSLSQMVSAMATRIMGQTTANGSFDCRGVLEAGLSVPHLLTAESFDT